MSLDRDISLLGSVELLAGLSGDELRLLAFGSEEMHYAKGRTIYREGHPADCGFVISSGAVDLSRRIHGEDTVLRSVGPGRILGEMALVTQTQRLTTAIAAEDTTLLRINRSLMRRMLEEYPQTAAALHARLSSRLKTFLDDIGRLETRFGTNS